MVEVRKYKSIMWECAEYEHRPKGADWYWVLSIITLAFAAAAIIFQNYLFAVFIIIAGFSLALHASKHPESRQYEIGGKGFRIGSTLYPYESMRSFWIETRRGAPRLFVEVDRLFMPVFSVPLGEADINLVRHELSARLKETEHDESFGHTILEYFGF